MFIKKSKKVAVICCLSLISLFSSHQSTFANLAYQPVAWPADDRSHFDNPKVLNEKWDFTGRLTAKQGETLKRFSYHVTLQYMRNTNAPTLNVQLTDLDNNKFYNKTVSLEKAASSAKLLDINAKDFALQGKSDPYKYHLRFTVPTDKQSIGFDLVMTPEKAPLLMGSNPKQPGLIAINNQTNIYDYSITRLSTTGSIQLGDDKLNIQNDKEQSQSWMDHQWSDVPVQQATNNNSWISMGLQLENGMDINVAGVIPATTSKSVLPVFANISEYDGTTTSVPAQLILGPHKKGEYPSSYTLKVGKKSYELKSVMPAQGENRRIMSVDNSNVLSNESSYAIVEHKVQS